MTRAELEARSRLPPSTYQVFDAVPLDGATLKQIICRSGLSKSSVRNALQVLLMAGALQRTHRPRKGKGPPTEFVFVKPGAA